jgi:hypothetical protein
MLKKGDRHPAQKEKMGRAEFLAHRWDFSADFAAELLANGFAYLDEALTLAGVLPLAWAARCLAATAALAGVDAHAFYGFVTGCGRHRRECEHGRSGRGQGDTG